MKKIEANDPLARSADIVDDNVEQLKVLFPDAVKEGKIDFDVLKQLLGSAVDERDEKYGLNWFGKRKARQLALTPSTGTLRPCPEDSVDWDTTENLMIEGDNLEVLKLLQKSYASKIKLIYIDPPYNTGKDFVYPDNFRDSIRSYKEITGQLEGGRPISSNTDTSGRYHTDWMNMMYPRLRIARELLRSDGLIFASCDDNEVQRLRFMLDEVFGEDNFASQLIIQSNKRGQTYKDVAKMHEYVLVYGKSDEATLFELAKVGDALPFEDAIGRFDLWELRNRNPKFGKHNRPNLYYPIYVSPNDHDANGYSKIALERSAQFSVPVTPQNSEGVDGCWRWSKEKIRTVDCSSPTAVVVGRQKRDGEWNIYEKSRKSTTKPKSIWDDNAFISEQGTIELGDLGLKDAFDHPKPLGLMRKIVSIGMEQGDIAMDFFAGSATTAHAVMAENSADAGSRKFIVVQLPETIDANSKEQTAAAQVCSKLKRPLNLAELTKERLRRAAKKIKAENPMFSGDTGFKVFKLDTSNIREWDPNREDIAGSLDESVEHLRADRTEEDVLFELLLKMNLELTVAISSKTIAGKTVHNIGAGTIMACLDRKISNKDVEKLALGIANWHKQLAPTGETVVIFRDGAFADDVAKTNLTAILEQAHEDCSIIVRSL